jgi:hypothetical protein
VREGGIITCAPFIGPGFVCRRRDGRKAQAGGPAALDRDVDGRQGVEGAPGRLPGLTPSRAPATCHYRARAHR